MKISDAELKQYMRVRSTETYLSGAVASFGIGLLGLLAWRLSLPHLADWQEDTFNLILIALLLGSGAFIGLIAPIQRLLNLLERAVNSDAENIERMARLNQKHSKKQKEG